jgi:hypothetical protein
MQSLIDQLATLVLQVAGILGAVVLLTRLTLRRKPGRAELRIASGVVIAVLAVVVTAGEIPSGASVLNQARRASVSARAGVDFCFRQGWPGNPGGAGAERLPFVHWLLARMGPHAVYTIDYTSPPDPNCLFLGLLPALPARPGEHADWTIAFGAVPPEMQLRIAAHDPSVRVFAPSYALERDNVQ